MPSHLTTDHVYMINEIAIKIKKNNRTNFLRLKFDPVHKSPVLIIPSSCSKQRIQTFLEESRATIVEKFKEFFSDQPTPSAVPFKGTSYQIEPQSKLLKLASIDEETKKIFIPASTIPQKYLISHIFKQQALHYFKTTCHDFANRMGAKIKAVKVRDYKSRWGSCAADGTITLSWRLIMAPQPVIDYVCAHETAHLIHFNHSKEFWRMVMTVSPDYKQAHQWLKANGYQLYQHL